MRTTFLGTRPAFLFGTKYVQSTGRQVDWDLIPDSWRQGAVKVIAGADAAQSATSMTLTVPVGTTLAKGDILYFGGAKFVKLAEPVIGNGAEQANIDVEALVTAITDLDVAYWGGHGPKFVPAGTIMEEGTNGKIIPRKLVTKTYTAVRTPKGSNGGNGVMTLAGTPVVAGGQVGTYKVVFIEPISDLGTFYVEDPLGVTIGEGVVGTAFSNQIAFTIADGSNNFVAGDSFTVAVSQTDGSNCAGLILTDACQDSITDASTGYGMVIGGVVWENLLPDATGSPGVITASEKAALVGLGQGFTFETYVDSRA